MEFRDFGAKRVIRQPSIDADELAEATDPLDGELALTAAGIERADAAGSTADGEISGSLLRAVDVSESRWGPLELTDVALRGADLSNAEWAPVTARRVEVVSCRATGWRLSLALAADLYVADTRLDYAVVRIDRTKGFVVFEGCAFGSAQLGGDLRNVLFVDCELDGVEFAATAAAGCDLTGSRIAGARGLHSLRGARISPEQAAVAGAQLAREAGLQVSADS
ncbi:hypothetical protein Athai_60140 [Actinocatenispora thailandica]|uniref:Pentapeptide repeat-containing protein n=1 Tax=Actinocatenispora thailandica TaxID=227318 RepID=A0A7R7I0F2_9ACTN|nr:hypothetical protein [Actinocatenispora thailandica]BCJ38511.1 hypothetical protein Athai_60140 [Actinocatenispora thailandica]